MKRTLHLSCACSKQKRCHLDIVKYALLIQRIWRGARTRVLYWRWSTYAKFVTGFRENNPSVMEFIEFMPVDVAVHDD